MKQMLTVRPLCPKRPCSEPQPPPLWNGLSLSALTNTLPVLALCLAPSRWRGDAMTLRPAAPPVGIARSPAQAGGQGRLPLMLHPGSGSGRRLGCCGWKKVWPGERGWEEAGAWGSRSRPRQACASLSSWGKDAGHADPIIAGDKGSALPSGGLEGEPSCLWIRRPTRPVGELGRCGCSWGGQAWGDAPLLLEVTGSASEMPALSGSGAGLGAARRGEGWRPLPFELTASVCPGQRAGLLFPGVNGP